jgi:hypothetical protein
MFAPPLQKSPTQFDSNKGGRRPPGRTALVIGRAGDAAERAADRAAGEVLRASEVGGPAQRASLSCGRFEPAGAAGGRAEAPAIVDEVLHRPGQPLDRESRAYFEPRFGRDFSAVRVHSDDIAARSAKAVGARAYTVGSAIVFGESRTGPAFSRHLVAHELAHVVQQAAAAPILQRYPDDAGPVDAGVPLPAGVPEEVPVGKLPDAELFQAYATASGSGQSDRAAALDEEMAKRMETWGTALPRGPEPVVGGAGGITPEVALKLLDNMSRGEPPFKPSEGRGGCSWFTTEGTPYTSVTADKSISVQVEIAKGSKPLIFNEASLLQLFQEEMVSASSAAEAQYRAKFNVPEGTKLSNRAMKAVKWNAARLAEGQMWTRVGKIVAASAQRVGEVILEPGSIFSKQPGKFAVVADAAKISLKGGTGPLVEGLVKQGVAAEQTVVQAAEQLATKMKWVGRVKTAFHYGGRVLIVVAAAADIYAIFRAENRLKAVVSVAGGWAAATAAGVAFAAWFAPADVAGPVAWAVHGVGTLIAGGIGYWIGSETTKYIYELVAE